MNTLPITQTTGEARPQIGPPPPEEVLKGLAVLMPSVLPDCVLPITRELDERDDHGDKIRLLHCVGVDKRGVETERLFVEVRAKKAIGSFTVEAVDKKQVYDTFKHPHAQKALIEERRRVMRGLRQGRREIEALTVAA